MESRSRAATSPAMRLLDRYLALAADERASDLHLEPTGTGLQIRMRVDGVLHAIEPPPASLVAPLLARTRLLARVDLAEHRLPQDGRFAFEHHGVHVDVRAAFMPVHGGEKLVLRMLQRERDDRGFDDLGLDGDEATVVSRALDAPHGLIVVVGPTGSGKTTTLYAAIEHLRRPELSIVTVEDPVERDVGGVAQIPVDTDCGRGFDVVLRTVLRLDPDVIMIGEMRDVDSARIACRAALTGHRVLTTLHTTDAIEALVRLCDMGVPRHLVAATVSLVIAQRLVRRLCSRCKSIVEPGTSELAAYHELGLMAPDRVAATVGCAACAGKGYRGRAAVFELLDLTASCDLEATPSRSLRAAGLALATALTTTTAEVVSTCPAPRG